MQFILDCGSGNTCKNDKKIVEQMITAIDDIRQEPIDLVLKWQLFEKAEPNIPLNHDIFEYAYRTADKYGLKTTASVFDKKSLKFLQGFEVPFIKLACNEKAQKLAKDIKGEVYMSVKKIPLYGTAVIYDPDVVFMCCVPQYPASRFTYYKNFSDEALSTAISDHTVGWKMFKKYQPAIYEKHFVLEHGGANPDAGLFAVTPQDLKGII